ncbi:hypothetical protein LDENG_00074170 [Lucifuga dentata]|nr:hypothetical protein LDENG_00074170 [Lucifuga dentata]
MGNEASLEGGEGPPSGLPEGLVPDGKGGFVRVPGGTPVDLNELSEEDRRQIAAAMSRAQSSQSGGAAAARRPSESDAQQRPQQVGAGARAPTGLSKSRTVDAFNQGSPSKPPPGRSPSSLSLLESRFRQQPKDPETKSTGMFGSSFLSGANPLSAMTSSVSSSLSSMGDSVNIPKFGLFGDDEEGGTSTTPESKQGGKPPGKGPQQGPGPKGPQQGGPQKQGQGPPGQGPKPGQGPSGQGPKQSQGPPGQGPKQGQGPPGQGPPGQGPKQGQGPPGQGPPGQQAPKPGQGPKQGGLLQQKGAPSPQGPGKPDPKQQAPSGPGSQPGKPAKDGGSAGQQDPGKPAGGLCPLCKTTKLNIRSKDPPNYSNCTECKNQVCSLCGFSPPDSAGKEWLCLNCQMQRAMGGMDPPSMMKPKQGSAPPSPQRQASGKPGKLLIKQQSTTDPGLTPPTTPRQKSPGPTSPGLLSPASSAAGSPKIDPKTGCPIQQKSSPQPSPAKAKQETSFFGGFGGISLGGFTDAAKPPTAASQASESVTGKLFGGFGGLVESAKPQAQATPKQEESVTEKLFGGFGPQAQATPKQEESVTEKLFGGFGGLTEAAKPPAAASQMFSFGSSLFSSATNLITGEDEKAADSPPGSPPDSPADSGSGSPIDSGPGSPPDSPFSAPGSPPDSESVPDTPPAKFTKLPQSISVEQEGKAPETKPTPGTQTSAESASASTTKESCPLCNVELNVGSAETPNYSHCTECKKTVCNLCGFNPTPHLGEKEWLCLSCQTQRAKSGQLGDVPPPAMASPKKQAPAPSSSSTPAPAAVDSKPVVEAAALTPTAPENKVEPTTTQTPDSSLISPDYEAHCPFNSSPQETQSKESPVSENVAESVPKIPEVEQQQTSSEKETDDRSLFVESETQNPLPNKGLDKTTAPAEVETELKPEISQSEAAAPHTDNDKVEPVLETLPQDTTNTAEPKPASFPIAFTQEIAVHPDPEPEPTAPSVNEEKIAKEELKLDQPADQTPNDTVDTTLNMDSTSTTQKPQADARNDVKNEIIAEIKAEPEPVVEKTEFAEASPHSPAEVVAAADKVEIPKPDETQEEQYENMKMVLEKTQPVSTSEEKIEAAPLELPDKIVPVAPVKGDTMALQKIDEVKTNQNKVFEECSIEERTAKQELPEEKAVEENSNQEKVVEEKAVDKVTIKERYNEEKEIQYKSSACKEEAVAKKASAIEQKTDENADGYRLLEEKVNDEEPKSHPTQTANETRNASLETEKKELGRAEEPCPLPKELDPISNLHKEVLQEKQYDKLPTEMTSLLEKLDEKEDTTTTEAGQKSAKSEKANTDPPATDSTEEEKFTAKEPVENIEIMSSSSVISKTQSGGEAFEEGLIQNKTEAGSDQAAEREKLTLTGSDKKQPENVPEQKMSTKEMKAKLDKKGQEVESQLVAGDNQKPISLSETSCNKWSSAEFDVGENIISNRDKSSETTFENVDVSLASVPVSEPDTPVSVVREQDKDSNENAVTEQKKEAKAQPLEKPSDEDAEAEVKKAETLKEHGEKVMAAKESSPTSPSDLAKLESTVLPILEAQAGTQPDNDEKKHTDTLKTRRKLEVLPLSPDSPSSEDDRELSEKMDAKGTSKKKLLVPTDVRGDSMDESSESFGKESPVSGDEEEDFIRKQIIEMSENEDASSDEENLIRQKIREEEKKKTEPEKSMSGKAKLVRKSTISPDDEEDKQLCNPLKKHDIQEDVGAEPKEGKQETGIAVRKFQTMELNTISNPMRIPNDDGEAEIESLTDSPDDRSRGEGSSSLHASSFTPGTSPTSVSSLDEDSDSSSPSHIHSGESKQHRKAKHRQPGQMLPTIEDSSEEEELREEEELLREQEKQKGSGKKSKKDKEEIRAQRRREHPKTTPSNLSPIEDASPTEELRQEAEMEEIRRSSCSDFSPSIESEPEGFEIHAAKIAAVQKTYELPISVSLHSPTDNQNTDKPQKKILKSADEAYEEIMLRAKSPTTEKVEIQPEKDSLYGGMLIEDYAYETLIDSTAELGEPEKIIVPAQPKKLRSPDEVYEDMIKKRKEFMQLEQEYQKIQSKKETTTPEIVLQPAENTVSKSSTATLDKDGKPLLDAETAYEELMKRVLSPGISPTQQEPDVEATAARKVLHPIPDLKVTQCSSGELSSDDEISAIKKEEETTPLSDTPVVTSAMETEPTAKVPPSATLDQEPHVTLAASQPDVVDLSSTLPRTAAPIIASVSPLPTVPQYTPCTPSVVSTAPPVPPKPSTLRRTNSQEKSDVPFAPTLPPPTAPKPTVFPRKPPVPLPPQATATPIRPETTAMTTAQGTSINQTVTPTYKPHVPPPVPPKPSIPAGMSYAHRPGDGVKPPIAPKPGSQPSSPAHVPHPPRPTALDPLTHCPPTETALNLSPSSENKQFQPSPKSPSSPRYASNLRDTYVVITLPSQPSSPVESISTRAPSSPGPASPSHHAQPQSYHQPQPQPQSYQQHPQPYPPQPTRVPLAYTRVTESIESQEICGPEKHTSSSCHIIEAISASAQPPVVTPNLISQVVTTEVQRTTVSVVHERTLPPVLAPRANGVPMIMEKPKPQLPVQNGQAFQPCEVVDLRTMKVDSESEMMNGVDLSAGPEPRNQTFANDFSGRQNSAVQSAVVNLSPESSTVSIVTDSITIVTCAATIQQYNNVDTSQASSVPLQLTKNKAFEPVSQIIYRPVDSQSSTNASAEIPINLSVGSSTSGGAFQTPPVTIAPTCVVGCVANGLTTGTTTVAGAVDLSTTKPFNTVVSVDATSTEVVTALITDDDGKPVDLTAGKRAVCCDVVYKLPFAGSCTTQQPTTPLPEDRFGYRDDHYQYDRSPYGMRGFGGIKPSMSDTNLAEAGLFFYKSKNSYNFSGTTDGAVDLTSAKISDAGEAVDYSKKGTYSGMTIPPYSQARVTGAVGTLFGTSSVLRSSNGVVYSSVSAPIPSTYAITTQPGSIFSTAYNTLSGMHTSDTMPSLSNLQNLPLTRSHSFISIISTTGTEEQGDAPINLEISRGSTTAAEAGTTRTNSLSLDTYTDASLEAIAASLEALSSPMVPGDDQYQAERERLEMEKLKQQRLAEELEWERQEIQRFREQEQLLVQKELEELQAMKQQILSQQEEERQAHLLMQKETYAQQQQQLEQIQRLQEQLRSQLEEQKLRQMYPGGDLPGHGQQEAIILGPDGAVLARKITDSGCQTDEEDETVSKAYTGRKKRSAKKSVDSCVQTDDEDQEEWEAQNRGRRRPRTARGDRGGQSDMSLQAHTEISIQTDSEGNIRLDTRMELSDSERTSPKKRPTPLEIGQSPNLTAESSTLQAPPKSPNVLYSPISPCISPSKSLEFVSYDKSLGDTSPQKLRGSTEPSKASPSSPRGPKAMQRSMSDPKPMSPGEEKATSGTQYGDSYTAKGSGGTPTGTQKKVKRTLPNPPSEDESTASGQTAYSTGSARRRMCRNSNMARAKILQDIDRELDLVERESSKLRKRQAELDEEEKEIDAKLRYLEMGINRRKDALLIEREKRERAYLQSVAEDRDYMSDSEVSNIRETRGGGEDEEIEGHGLEHPRTATQSELDEFVPPQTKHEYGKYAQYQYPQSQYQQSLYQTPQSYQSQSIYSSVPSLTSAQQQSYHQMLLLQQKAARQAALLSELDATKYDVISRQPDPTSSAYLGVKYDKYGNHLDLRALEVGSIAGTPMSAVSDTYYTDVDHHTPRSYMLLEDAADLAKGSTGLSSSYSLAERELAKAEKLLRRSAAELGSTDYLGSTSRLHAFGKTPDEEDSMEEPYELKLLKQQLKQEFRRSTGSENLEQLTGLSHHYYTPSSGISSYSQRHYPKSEKYSIGRLTLEKQAAKQLPASMLYQKHKSPLLDPKISSKYSSITDSRALETDYTSYLGSGSGSPRSSRLMQDEITFGLRKNVAEQQRYLGSTLGANLAGSLNLGQSLGLDSAYPSGSRSRPSSRPTSCYGLDLSIKRDPSSSSLRLKGDGEASGDGSSFQTPSGRTKPTSLPIVQSGRGRIPIVAQNSEEESPLSPVGQPMGMARASAGPLPPISADSRDQFGSCLSLQDSQQQHIREEPTRGRGYVLLDDLQGTMSDSEALSDSLVALNRDDAANAYHLRQEETDWFDKPRDGRSENGQEKRQGKGPYYPFPHLRVKLQRDPKDRSVSGNGLGIRVVGGKEVPGSNGDIGAYVAKVLPGGAAEQTGKILEGMQVLEWNGILLTGKTYEEVQGLVGQQCSEAELCVRLDLNMLSDSEDSQHLDFQEHSKGDRPPRSPGVDPKQLAAELQKVSQQQAPPASSTSSTGLPITTSATSSPGQPGSPSVSKKRHSSKTAEGVKTQSHPISGEIQLQIHYDKQLGTLIVHVLQARNLAPRDNNGYSDPFVKVYLLPGRGQVMVVQNASAENKRRSKHAGKSLNPEWNQTVIYKNIHLEQLRKKTLEVSVWDYDKCSSNDFLGEVLIDLSSSTQLDNVPRWLPLKEQSEGDHHRRSHSGQGRQHSSKTSSQHSSPKTGSGHDNQDSPKSSVIKSRSHGLFPDPAKDMQVPTIEKSHSSPGTSKPSPSEGQSQSHGHSQHSRSRSASRSSKSAARQHHQESGTGGSGGAAIATGDAPLQPQQQPPQRLQPSKPRRK